MAGPTRFGPSSSPGAAQVTLLQVIPHQQVGGIDGNCQVGQSQALPVPSLMVADQQRVSNLHAGLQLLHRMRERSYLAQVIYYNPSCHLQEAGAESDDKEHDFQLEACCGDRMNGLGQHLLDQAARSLYPLTEVVLQEASVGWKGTL